MLSGDLGREGVKLLSLGEVQGESRRIWWKPRSQRKISPTFRVETKHTTLEKRNRLFHDGMTVQNYASTKNSHPTKLSNYSNITTIKTAILTTFAVAVGNINTSLMEAAKCSQRWLLAFLHMPHAPRSACFNFHCGGGTVFYIGFFSFDLKSDKLDKRSFFPSRNDRNVKMNLVKRNDWRVTRLLMIQQVSGTSLMFNVILTLSQSEGVAFI